MRPNSCLVALLMLAGSTVAAAAPGAPAAYLTIDHSVDGLMDARTADEMWKPRLSARLLRLYPEKKWGFVSQVEGGFDSSRTCVVTARAMMLPRSGKALLFRPFKTATSYGSQTGASDTMCKAYAKVKLGEAMDSITSSLMRQ